MIYFYVGFGLYLWLITLHAAWQAGKRIVPTERTVVEYIRLDTDNLGYDFFLSLDDIQYRPPAVPDTVIFNQIERRALAELGETMKGYTFYQSVFDPVKRGWYVKAQVQVVVPRLPYVPLKFAVELWKRRDGLVRP